MGDAIIWWISLQLLGLAAIPVAAVLLRALPDRGYTLSKPLGLLLTGWLAYTLAMLKIVQFDRLLVIMCLLLLGAFSAFLLLRRGRALLYDLRDHFSDRSTIVYVLVSELVFALAFIVWAIIRSYYPDIVDTEKFMDFGFLNSILKSGTFPPNDMWLAGFSINYYYFGYILIAALTALSGVPTQVAFNLANVGVFALTALAAFGVVHNIVTARLLVRVTRGRRRTKDEGLDDRRPTTDDNRRSVSREREREREASAQPVPERRQKAGKAAQSQVPTRQAATAPAAPVASNALPSRRAKAQAVSAAVAEPVEADTRNDTSETAEETRNPQSAIRNPQSPAYLPVSEAQTEKKWVPWFLSPYIFAIIAALMVVAMGNLTAVFATHDGPKSEGNGFRFCFLCNTPNTSFFTYAWPASRVIQDYITSGDPPTKREVGYETINEFPAFSFVLADLHPHVMALPFVILAVALGFALTRRRVIRAGTWRDGVPPDLSAWTGIILTGLLTGSLYTINTWDFPTYLLVVLLCLAVPYLAAARRQGLGWRWLQPYIVQVILIGIFAIVTFLPFHLTFKSLVGGGAVQIPSNLANIPIVGWILEKLGTLVLINNADKTILGFVVIFGIFLAILLVWLGMEFFQYMQRQSQVDEEWRRGLYYWIGFFVVTLLAAFVFKFPLLGLLLPMAAVALALVWREPKRTERNAVLIFVAIAAIIGLSVEVVFLRDNFQMRMNTLFKFYYQIWILWALAAGYAFWRVLYSAFGTNTEPTSGRDRYAQQYYYGPSTGMKTLAGTWGVIALLLVLSGLMYSYYAVGARQINGQTMRGLDGTDWLRRDPNALGDYDAINWLKNNGTNKDRVLEAGRDEYSRPGRVSSYSGVSTLVAWDNSHEALWRTNQPDASAEISARRTIVDQIYQGVDPRGGPLTAARLLELLKLYNVTYVFVGAVERGQPGYAPGSAGETITEYAEAVFKQAMPEAFRSGNTVIYQVKDTISGTGVAPATPVAGVTPGATSAVDPNVPPVGLFDLGASGANRGQFALPRGIARDSEGNFYVADTQNERIQKFDKDGKWLLMFGGKGNGDGQFNPFSDDATGTGLGGLAVDSAGNVYVADTWNHRIQKFDKDGKFLTKWGTFINLADTTADNDPDRNIKFFGPRGVAIGPDGNIYVTDTGNKRVLIFTPDGASVRQIDSGENSTKKGPEYPFDKDGEMNEPIGIAVDKQGVVYVADVNNRRIQKFDAQGKFAGKWTVPAGAWDPGPYLEPFLALDIDGNLYATAPTGKSVIKFSPDGSTLGEKNGNGTISLKLPTGLVVGEDRTVYVVDTNGNGVMKLGTIP